MPSRAEEGTARESALRTRLLVMLGAPVSYIYICVCVCMYKCIYIHICIYIYIYIYI